MNYLKRHLMAIASSCIMTVSAHAYTFEGYYYHPDVNEYTVKFQKQSDEPDQDLSAGKCKLCWYSECWEYDYIYDGNMAIYIHKYGIMFKFGDKLNDTRSNVMFQKAYFPTCIRCNP